MTVTVIISVEVSDFDEWKTMFNEIEQQRVAAGIHAKPYRKPGDPNAAYVIGTAPSKEAFTAFITSPERMKIQNSGIITSQPTITFLEDG
ncbi:MAG: hypothetical protein VYD25_01415 [Pseudomonadota bacterium]|mgnify:CR=1 FL=1|nr:hypothetical protein [Pseudomonadota bacterium]MED5406374.1 hypothetical protein [Pseudomonadota bacterium]MEE3288085.1 hypothetical protein [Pseudomonadota bacterium]